MKKYLLFILLLMLILSGCTNQTTTPMVTGEAASAEEEHLSFLVVGKMDVYKPEESISIQSPIKITSYDMLVSVFEQYEILPALQSFYDETFFKKHILVVKTIVSTAESYQLKQSNILDSTLFISIDSSGVSGEKNILFCIQYGNGAASAVNKITFDIK